MTRFVVIAFVLAGLLAWLAPRASAAEPVPVAELQGHFILSESIAEAQKYRSASEAALKALTELLAPSNRKGEIADKWTRITQSIINQRMLMWGTVLHLQSGGKGDHAHRLTQVPEPLREWNRVEQESWWRIYRTGLEIAKLRDELVESQAQLVDAFMIFEQKDRKWLKKLKLAQGLEKIAVWTADKATGTNPSTGSMKDAYNYYWQARGYKGAFEAAARAIGREELAVQKFLRETEPKSVKKAWEALEKAKLTPKEGGTFSRVEREWENRVEKVVVRYEAEWKDLEERTRGFVKGEYREEFERAEEETRDVLDNLEDLEKIIGPFLK